jgi:hypothetical protein
VPHNICRPTFCEEISPTVDHPHILVRQGVPRESAREEASFSLVKFFEIREKRILVQSSFGRGSGISIEIWSVAKWCRGLAVRSHIPADCESRLTPWLERQATPLWP